MRFFIDSANIEQIRQAAAWGLADGVTTNPSLMAKEGGDWREVARAICREISGPVSLEVIGETTESMLQEALELIKFGPNVVVKIPMTLAGLERITDRMAKLQPALLRAVA